MSRKVVVFLIALLAGLTLLASTSVLAQPASPDAQTSYPDIEPNDTPAQAVPVSIGTQLYGSVSLSDPIDYYSFTADAGDAISLKSNYGLYSDYYEYTLLDSSLNSVTLLQSFPYAGLYQAILPDAGIYYLGITETGLEAYPSYYNIQLESLLDVEPNDTPAQASLVELGDYLTGYMNESDTVDYYRFTGVAGDTVAFIEPEGQGSNWSFTPELLNASLNPIPLQPYSNWATLPANGTYYFKLTALYLNTYPRTYSYQLVTLTGDEPNDTFATALSAEAFQTVQGTWDYECDVDMYRFNGHAGDVFPITWYGTTDFSADYDLYDANGTLLQDANVLPADGTYYLQAYGWWSTDDDGDCYQTGDEYTITFGYPLWVSASQNGLGGNNAIKSSDIAMRADQPGKWQLVFDASDVGITKNINAIERLDDGSILMSLATTQTVPGLGKVMPQDIIRFIPTSLGEATAGSFEWYLDGSDVGLTTAGENIDAIHYKPFEGDENPLTISVSGSGATPRQSGGTLQFKDEDLINFVGTSYGANSAGAWRMNLDGSTIPGMAAEDISASTYIDLVPARLSRLLLVFNSSFNIGGLKGGARDVVELETGLVVKGLTNKAIDAMTVGVPLTP